MYSEQVRIRCCQNGENYELHCKCLLFAKHESVSVLCTYVIPKWQNVAEIKGRTKYNVKRIDTILYQMVWCMTLLVCLLMIL
jgi:hypothetical protein